MEWELKINHQIPLPHSPTCQNCDILLSAQDVYCPPKKVSTSVLRLLEPDHMNNIYGCLPYEHQCKL